MSSGQDTAALTASILVPVLDEASRLERTAIAAIGQDVAGPIEVLFIDGGSVDGSRAILDRLAADDERVRVIDNPERVVPAALNRGLAVARGAYIARMDAHTIYPSDYVARGIERLERGDVEWVTGPVYPDAPAGFARCVAAALRSPLGQGGSAKWAGTNANVPANGEVELDTGVFAGVWRRATLERLEGWDPEFHVNEDAEMAARVLSDGGRIVCLPAMAARYSPRETPLGLWRQYWRFGAYRAKTSRRHPIALRPEHLASAALVTTVAMAVAPRGPLRRPARAVTLLWAATIGAVGARAASSRSVREAGGIALALATMHLAWGAGFVWGCLRGGPPLRAVRCLLSRR
ncbi:MAG: succinoglycan biosynthesis protein ExoA [Solirubrobacteraceae bacterium]|nr:succinoglycan biosynthesis protein ExoA [Solirubrobacteraceae bacterium]